MTIIERENIPNSIKIRHLRGQAIVVRSVGKIPAPEASEDKAGQGKQTLDILRAYEERGIKVPAHSKDKSSDE